MLSWLKGILFVLMIVSIAFFWGAAFWYVIPSITDNWFGKIVSIIVGAYGVVPAVLGTIVCVAGGLTRGPEPRLIVIAGAPGSGKSTLAAELRSRLKSPHIDFGKLREFHLEPDWSNQSVEEREMSFENLIALIKSYAYHGRTNILVDDLQDAHATALPHLLELQVCIVTLTLSDDDELRRRIAIRNDGWKDPDTAVAWNHDVIKRPAVAGEHRIDVTHKTPAQVVEETLGILGIDQSHSV
jgi:broad-specificity NMP kinase